MMVAPLRQGNLLRRYKRFFADVVFDDGSEITAHCPNPGSMKTLLEQPAEIWLRHFADPKRKLPWGAEILRLPSGANVGINTLAANAIVEEAFHAGELTCLPAGELTREFRYGKENSRADFLLRAAGGSEYIIEVKNVTMSEPAEKGLARFPDSVTARGAKHLRELSAPGEGRKGVLIYLINRDDCDRFSLADIIDPGYARAAEAAAASGVSFFAFGCGFDFHADSCQIRINRKVALI